MATTLNAPQIQSDETLYSYIARCQWLWGETSYERTSIDWFGRKGICLNQCLPCHIERIGYHSEYEVEYLLNNHTAFPLHFSFNSRSEELKKSMCSSLVRNVANQSCSPQLSFGSYTQSRFCPKCVDEDEANTGIAYWHLSHQIWGLCACYKHGCRLEIHPFEARKYRLPFFAQEVSAVQSVKAEQVQALFAQHVIKLLRVSVSLDKRRKYIRELFLTRGLLTPRMRIRMPFVLERVKNTCDELGLPNVLNARIIRRIVFAPELSIHPLKPLLLEFAVKGMSATSSPTILLTPRPHKPYDEIAVRAKALLESYQYSVAEISRRLHVSKGYVKQLANRLNIKTKENKKMITSEIRRLATDLAIENTSLHEIASKLGISEASVTEIIQSVSGLSLWRQYMRMLEKRRVVRATLLAEAEGKKDLNRVELKTCQGNYLSWSYQYDRAWLDMAFPITGNKANHSSKIWEKRDATLLRPFKEFLRSHLHLTGKLPSKYALDKEFGEHRWFSCNFAKLMRCKRMYDKARSITVNNKREGS